MRTPFLFFPNTGIPVYFVRSVNPVKLIGILFRRGTRNFTIFLTGMRRSPANKKKQFVWWKRKYPNRFWTWHWMWAHMKSALWLRKIFLWHLFYCRICSNTNWRQVIVQVYVSLCLFLCGFLGRSKILRKGLGVQNLERFQGEIKLIFPSWIVDF